MNHLKGEALNVGFDVGIKLELHGAEVTVNKELFKEILYRIEQLRYRAV